MKLIYLSLIFCMVPHTAYTSASAAAAVAKPPLASCARLIKAQSLLQKQPHEDKKQNQNVICGNLFITDTKPHDTSSFHLPDVECLDYSLANIVTDQGEPAKLHTSDALVRVSMNDPELATQTRNSLTNKYGSIDEIRWFNGKLQAYLEFMPLVWLHDAQTDDLLELKFKNPRTTLIHLLQLKCCNRNGQPKFEDAVKECEQKAKDQKNIPAL